jgi:hypothetical protein
VSCHRRGETAAVSFPGAGGRFSGHRYWRPGLQSLRGPRRWEVAKNFCPAQHASVVTGSRVPAVARWSAVNGSGQSERDLAPTTKSRSEVQRHHHEA